MQQLDPLIRLIGVYDDLEFDLRLFGRAILPRSAKGNVNPALVEIEHGNDAARPLKDTKNKADQTQLSGLAGAGPLRHISVETYTGIFCVGFRAMRINRARRYSIFKPFSLRQGALEKPRRSTIVRVRPYLAGRLHGRAYHQRPPRVST